jgi:uncharacterized protein (UPF0332 family)
MSLTEEERRLLVEYRMEKAAATFIEAQDNACLNHWTLAANRLYYAAYYASSALLLNKGFAPKTHEGVNVMIHRELVKSGQLTTEDGQLLSRLQVMRHSGDYDDLFEWKESDVQPYFLQTRAYIDKIKALIAGENHASEH